MRTSSGASVSATSAKVPDQHGRWRAPLDDPQFNISEGHGSFRAVAFACPFSEIYRGSLISLESSEQVGSGVA